MARMARRGRASRCGSFARSSDGGKAGFIDGQDGGLLAQLLKRVDTQVIAHPIGVPDSAGEQALHPIGTCFSRVFSQLPAIFSGRFATIPCR